MSRLHSPRHFPACSDLGHVFKCDLWMIACSDLWHMLQCYRWLCVRSRFVRSSQKKWFEGTRWQTIPRACQCTHQMQVLLCLSNGPAIQRCWTCSCRGSHNRILDFWICEKHQPGPYASMLLYAYRGSILRKNRWFGSSEQLLSGTSSFGYPARVPAYT